eukprot:453843_1
MSCPSKPKPCVGIDLGTDQCIVSYWDGIKVVPLLSFPCVITINDKDGRIIGDNATCKNNCTLFHLKRLIGRRYSDDIIQHLMKYLPFSIIKGKQDRIMIQINETTYYIEEIMAMLLRHVKSVCIKKWEINNEKQLNTVISVPHCFGDLQRQSIKDCAKLAGLNVLRLINDNSASLIAYYSWSKQVTVEDRNVLICDIGANTMNISVANWDDEICEIKNTSGNILFGGILFDDVLVTYFANLFNSTHKKIDITKSIHSMLILRHYSEKIKILLSSVEEASITIPALYDDIDFVCNLNRKTFESLCEKKFIYILYHLDIVIKDSKLTKDKINDLILVGGSTKIPKIRNLMKEYFDDKDINEFIFEQSVSSVSYGASIQSAILSGNEMGDNGDILLIDVCNYGIMVKIADHIVPDYVNVREMIPKNKTIPCKATEVFSVGFDPVVKVETFEGKDNYALHKYEIIGHLFSSASPAIIELTFDLDANGILSTYVTQKNNPTQTKKAFIYEKDSFNLTETEIRNSIQKESERTKLLLTIGFIKNAVKNMSQQLIIPNGIYALISTFVLYH